MTKPKPPTWVVRTRYEPGQRWITWGRTAVELPYTVVRDESRSCRRTPGIVRPPEREPWSDSYLIVSSGAPA
jgi:hypothetical protein